MDIYDPLRIDPLYKPYIARIEESKTKKDRWIRHGESTSFQLVSDFLVCPQGYEKSTVNKSWCIKTRLPDKRTGIADENIKYMVDPLPEPSAGEYTSHTPYPRPPPDSTSTYSINPYTGERHNYHEPKPSKAQYARLKMKNSYL